MPHQLLQGEGKYQRFFLAEDDIMEKFKPGVEWEYQETDDPNIQTVYTRNQAADAVENGAHVLKIRSKPDDTHEDGAAAVIIGSVALDEEDEAGGFMYWVEWEADPGIYVAIGDSRVEVPSVE